MTPAQSRKEIDFNSLSPLFLEGYILEAPLKRSMKISENMLLVA